MSDGDVIEAKNAAEASQHHRLRQLTPTVIWWLSVNGTVFAKVVSLAQYKPAGAGWLQYAEHWFIAKQLPNNMTLASLLGTPNSQLLVEAKFSSSGPLSPAFQAEAASCLNSNAWKFQWYGQGTLTDSDWIPGTPSGLTNPSYFVQTNASVPAQRAQLVFEVQPNQPMELARLWWVTNQKHSGYSSTFSCQRQASVPSQWPTPSWYIRFPMAPCPS
jgi:hypothetical protein